MEWTYGRKSYCFKICFWSTEKIADIISNCYLKENASTTTTVVSQTSTEIVILTSPIIKRKGKFTNQKSFYNGNFKLCSCCTSLEEQAVEEQVAEIKATEEVTEEKAEELS